MARRSTAHAPPPLASRYLLDVSVRTTDFGVLASHCSARREVWRGPLPSKLLGRNMALGMLCPRRFVSVCVGSSFKPPIDRTRALPKGQRGQLSPNCLGPIASRGYNTSAARQSPKRCDPVSQGCPQLSPCCSVLTSQVTNSPLLAAFRPFGPIIVVELGGATVKREFVLSHTMWVARAGSSDSARHFDLNRGSQGTRLLQPRPWP